MCCCIVVVAGDVRGGSLDRALHVPSQWCILVRGGGMKACNMMLYQRHAYKAHSVLHNRPDIVTSLLSLGRTQQICFKEAISPKSLVRPLRSDELLSPFPAQICRSANPGSVSQTRGGGEVQVKIYLSPFPSFTFTPNRRRDRRGIDS